MECSVVVCDRKSSARGFCAPHYYRFMRGGDISQPIKSRQSDSEKCRVCAKRQSWLDTGKCRLCLVELGEWKFKPRYEKNAITCAVDECNTTARRANLCGKHYQQYQSGKDFTLDDPRYVKKPCPVVGCERWATGKAYLCRYHQKTSWRYRIPEKDIPRIYGPNACCAVCQSKEQLSIDHNHACCPQSYGTCGECNRGLLCRMCNAALGLTQENPRTLRGLLDYLESPPGL